MFSRDRQTALVTGASSGMGKQMVVRLIEAGYQVYAAARHVEKMDDLTALGARTLRVDISKSEEVAAAVDTILREAGRVDVLVNNAGFGLYGPIEEISLAQARYQFDVNLFGVADLTQRLLPSMRERGGGTIINITSMGGKIYTLLGGWYHATKHALEGWSDCLRLELAPFGIRVVVIEPGLIETAFGDVAASGLKAQSAGGPYAAVKQSVAAATERSYGHGQGTSPDVIARLVVKAAEAARPRTRYVAGAYARPMIEIRRWLGDRVFDRVILSQVR